MNVVNWIKLNGYDAAVDILDKLPKNTTHMTNDGRMYVNAKDTCLLSEINSQLNNMVCISDLKKFTYSIGLVNDLGGLNKAIFSLWRAEFNKLLTISYFKNGEEWTVHRLLVDRAIKDFVLIYGDNYE